MTVTITTTTTDIVDAIGNPASGSVSVRPNSSWTFADGAGGLDKIDPKPVIITIAAGKISSPSPLHLAPTLNGGVTALDASYTATFSLNGTPEYTEVWVIDGSASSMEWADIQVSSSSLTGPGAGAANSAAQAKTSEVNAAASAAASAADRALADASANAADTSRIASEQAASAADADRIAAEAAWTAALASNPDLNPQIRMNPAVVSADLAVPDGYNAYASGPLEVAKGVTITVGANAALNII